MNFKSFRKVLSLFLYQAYEKKRIKQICTVLGVFRPQEKKKKVLFNFRTTMS